MDKTGIYKITNLVNNKAYVGYASNFRKRKGDHFANLKLRKHKNIHLQRAYDKYGKENFTCELLEECLTNDLPARENFWCNQLNTHDDKFGYNIRPTGQDTLVSHSEETRKKISEKLKGKKLSPEHIASVVAAHKGIPLTEEHKTKVKEGIHNTYKKGVFKLDEGKVKEIVVLINQGIKTSKIAKLFGVTRHTISGIKYGHNWHYLNLGVIKQNKSRLSVEQIQDIRRRALIGEKYKGIAKEYGILDSVISRIKKNPNYGM